MDKHSKNFNKETENIGKYQTEVITEPKYTLEGFNSRMKEIEAQISRLEDNAMENTQTEKKKGLKEMRIT